MYNNPYLMNQQPQMNRYPNMEQYQPMQPQQYIPQQPMQKPIGLLGKSVDSIDVVKAMDIPLDGSISYFPLTDESAIVTKKLQSDGTSKIVIYKPFTEEKQVSEFVTRNELEKALESFDFSEFDDIKEDIRDIRKEIKDLKSKK